MLSTRNDWLLKHAEEFPQWKAIVEALIARNYFVVIPAKYGWKDGGVEDQDLMVLEPGVKGPPAAYRLDGDKVECVNYSGSFEPKSVTEWLKMVEGVVASNMESDWIEEILSQ